MLSIAIITNGIAHNLLILEPLPASNFSDSIFLEGVDAPVSAKPLPASNFSDSIFLEGVDAPVSAVGHTVVSVTDELPTTTAAPDKIIVGNVTLSNAPIAKRDASNLSLLAVFPQDAQGSEGETDKYNCGTRATEFNWFRHMLSARGIISVCISIEDMQRKFKKRGCYSASEYPMRSLPDCPEQQRYVQEHVLAHGKMFKNIYLDGSARQTWAAFMSLPGLNLIKGGTSKTVTCSKGKHGKYDRLLTTRQLDKFRIVIVDSGRTKHLCGSPLRERMLNLGEYYSQGASGIPSLAALQRQRAKAEKRYHVPRKDRYIFAAGVSARDFKIVMDAVRNSGVSIRIYRGGKSYPHCDSSNNCIIMPRVTKEKYFSDMDEALFIAIPLLPYGKTSAGLSSLVEGVSRGKVVAITDKNNHLVDDYVHHGKSGFRMRVKDSKGWQDLVQTMSSAKPAKIYEMELAALAVSAEFSQEVLTNKFLNAVRAVNEGRPLERL